MRQAGGITEHRAKDGRVLYRVRVTLNGARESLGLFTARHEAEQVLAAMTERMGRTGDGALGPGNRSALCELKQLPDLPWPTTGGIYFVLGGRLVKIGKAGNVAHRLSGIQVGCPSPLRLLAVDRPGREREHHRRFCSSRAHGEWFKPTAELVQFVVTLRATRPDQRALSGHHIETLNRKRE